MNNAVLGYVDILMRMADTGPQGIIDTHPNKVYYGNKAVAGHAQSVPPTKPALLG
ncbi:MAG TPA: hypothetical protein VLK82_13705 [Candidatus Tectomicrobia bacterium]|nr:hypothetical protein [Candidatus Tectomicrobia bacterium]